MEEWDPKRGGSRQAFEVKTFICPGCNLLEGEIDYQSKQKTSMPGFKAHLTPTSLHPTLAHMARTHKR